MAPTQTTRVRPYNVRAVKTNSRYRLIRADGFVLQDTPRLSTTNVGGSQYTESEGHPFYRSRQKGMSDLGGEFFTTKRYVDFGKSVKFSKTNLSPGTKEIFNYYGICCAVDPSMVGYVTGIPLYSNDTEMDAYGATAISVVAPTNPVGSLLTALTELKREGLPHLDASQTTWKPSIEAARSAGDNYLATQFGIRPLLNDIASFGSTVMNAPAVIEQYRRNIGRPIRRTYQLPTVSTSSEVQIGQTKATLPFMHDPSYYYSYGTLFRTTTVLRKRWFSGCFTYYFPSNILGSEKLSDLSILAGRLGLEPTPEVAWQVAPWSWAVDWFSNVGDVVNNWSQFHTNGLVMRYGYVMEHSIVTNTYHLVGCLPAVGGGPPISDVSFITETKTRRKANPYGFGVSWDGLSSFQTSILAALAITRT
uniref:Maturation n=1 Tax=Leviviridae sp. TaxID=2027243 RepID=A0A514DC49_9VIRU|nr:MAG: hypothetical protein H3Bulk41458_000003 [Leviviridae sp.]